MTIKKTIPTVQRTPNPDVELDAIVEAIARRINAPIAEITSTNISAFKSHYSTVLDRADAGTLEVVTRRNKRYLVLSEKQMLELVGGTKSQCTVAELFADLPTLPATTVIPQVVSVAVPDQYRIPKGKLLYEGD